MKLPCSSLTVSRVFRAQGKDSTWQPADVHTHHQLSGSTRRMVCMDASEMRVYLRGQHCRWRKWWGLCTAHLQHHWNALRKTHGGRWECWPESRARPIWDTQSKGLCLQIHFYLNQFNWCRILYLNWSPTYVFFLHVFCCIVVVRDFCVVWYRILFLIHTFSLNQMPCDLSLSSSLKKPLIHSFICVCLEHMICSFWIIYLHQ